MTQFNENTHKKVPMRMCTVCKLHAPIAGSTNKPDAFGNRIFVCKECSFPENNLSPLIEKV